MLLREKLSDWDGKTVSYLSDLFNAERPNPNFVDQLLELLSEDKLQSAVTWLLKYALENAVTLEAAQAYELLSKVDILTTWQAKLHLLQMMPLLHLPENLKYHLAGFCRSSTEDENKFVRAWGYNGLYELATIYSEFRDGLEIVFASAMETEPASVKARLRNIQQKINTNWN